MSESKPWKDCELEEELRECIAELEWYREKLKKCKEELKKCQRKQKKYERDYDKDEEEPKKPKRPRNECDHEDHPKHDDKDDKKRDNYKRRYRKDKDFEDDNEKDYYKPRHEKNKSFKDELKKVINRKVGIRCGNNTQYVVVTEVKDSSVKAIAVETGAIVAFQMSQIDYVEYPS